MRETKKRLELFSFYDYTAIERHLEKMARQGWRLTAAGARGLWTYRRAEPAELRYAVVYFPDASQFDPEPTEGQQTLRDYCLAAGWEPVADWGQMQIYVTDRTEVVPIDTDPSIQLETIHKTMKRTFLPSYLLLLAVFLFQGWTQLKDLYWEMADYLSKGTSLASLLSFLLGMALVTVELGGYFLWRRRSKRSIARGGGCVPSRGHHCLTWTLLGLMVLTLVVQVVSLGSASTGIFMGLYLAGLAGMLWAVWHIQSALKRRKFSRKVNRTVTLGATVALSVLLMLVFTAGLLLTLRTGITERPPAETYEAYGMTWNVYHDPIPLRIEDLLDVDYDGWSTKLNIQSTPLVTTRVAVQDGRMGDRDIPELAYAVTDVHVPLLRDAVLAGYLRREGRYDRDLPEEMRQHYEPADAAPWGADEAYRLYDGGGARNVYLLRWGGRIVRLQPLGMEDLTSEQMARAAEKLQGA